MVQSLPLRWLIAIPVGGILVSLLLFGIVRGRTAPAWRASSLGVPAPEARWLLSGTFDGGRVLLRMPEDWPPRAALPDALRATLQRKIALRNRNVEILGRLAREAEARLARMRLRQEAEFHRTLDEVVVSVHPTDVDGLDALHRHRPVLEVLPDYTRITFFVPSELETDVRRAIDAMGLGPRTQIHTVPLWEANESGIRIFHETTTWTQDLFEMASDDDGTQWVLVPASRSQIEDLSRPDNDYVEALAAAGHRNVLRLPIFFRPGNTLVGEIGGARVLFVGEQEASYNAAETFEAAAFSPPDDAYLALLNRIFGADRAFILPNTELLFHIDMAMSFLGEGTVALLEPVDPENLTASDRGALAAMRGALAAAGFRIVPIPTATEWMRRFQSPVNVLLYVDRRDGRRAVIVPRYAEPPATGAGTAGLNERVRAAYEVAGFEVRSVEDRFGAKHGDIHCAFNIVR